MNREKDFYNSAYEGDQYAAFLSEREHFAYDELVRFIEKYHLQHARCLEVGSGRGVFQDLVDDYTGFDISETVAARYHKPFRCGSVDSLPFPDGRFEAIWCITVLEHVRDPELALTEMRRVLEDDGVLFLKPAWNCRWWNCEGIPVRRYKELSLRQKWVKATLPIRGSVLTRALKTLPRRMGYILRKSPPASSLRYRQLNANYETFWMADSDACSSIDPFDAIAWFRSHGDEVLSHPTWWTALLSRSEPLIVRVNKQSERDSSPQAPKDISVRCNR